MLLTAARATPDSPSLQRRHGAQYQLAVVATSASWRAISASANFSPNGFNFEQWKDDEFDEALKTISEATDPKAIVEAYREGA